MAGGDFLVERGARGPHGLVELTGNDRSQGVRGKVAEVADGPVNVLQAAFHIIRRTNVQALLKIGIPGFRQVGHGQRAFEHFLFQVVAQHDVHRIGQLIRIHADAAAAHADQQSIQVGFFPFWPADLQIFLEQRP